MKSQKRITQAVMICYGILALIGTLIFIGGGNMLDGKESESIAGGVAAAMIGTIASVIGIAYALCGIIALFLRALSYYRFKRALVFFCLPFDLWFFLVHLLLTLHTLGTLFKDPVEFIICFFLWIIAGLPLTLNVITLVKSKGNNMK